MIQDNNQLVQDFKKYERYIYTIIGTNTYHSKTSTKTKVNIYNMLNLGYTFEDLVQEGRKYIWEALLNYGKFPERTKNVNRKIASKSTFVFVHLRNCFINLSIKASSRKYSRVDVELEKCAGILKNNTTSEDILIFKEEYEKVK